MYGFNLRFGDLCVLLNRLQFDAKMLGFCYDFEFVW